VGRVLVCMCLGVGDQPTPTLLTLLSVLPVLEQILRTADPAFGAFLLTRLYILIYPADDNDRQRRV